METDFFILFIYNASIDNVIMFSSHREPNPGSIVHWEDKCPQARPRSSGPVKTIHIKVNYNVLNAFMFNDCRTL